jgi:hypothetical protein
MSAIQVIAGSCNSSCARAVGGLGRIISRYLWYRFHYWSIPMAIGLSFIVAFAKGFFKAIIRHGAQFCRTCPSGCGCRYGTDDPDRYDCWCDGPCTTASHEEWFG